MTENRPIGSWLGALTGLFALAGALTLTACGGGGGAPNTPYVDGRPPQLLAVLPNTMVDLYMGVPTMLTVTGGLPPYRAVSSNSAVVPVANAVADATIVLLATDVAADTPVSVTVQDTRGAQAIALLTVHPAPLVNGLTVTPNLAECGTASICSGQTGTASVKLQGPGGGALAGRQVRFDVAAGPFGIVSNAPGSPVVSSLTVVSDAAGNASVIIKANVDAPTQPAQIRATELTSGQQVSGNFTIVQRTDGATILTVIPETATITAAFKNECTAGFQTDYYIYGGTPPYRVTSTFPSAVTLLNSTVNASGGFFSAITNGTCVDPLVFSIVDATGRQVQAKLQNLQGTEDAPAAPAPALLVTPSTSSFSACAGKTFNVLISGGTAPYNTAYTGTPATTPLIAPSSLSAPGFVAISNLVSPGSGSNVYNFRVVDSVSAVASFSITCTP